MKKLQILGTGCDKCIRLAANTEEAARRAGIECEIEKVTDINQIMAMGVMMKFLDSGEMMGPPQLSE